VTSFELHLCLKLRSIYASLPNRHFTATLSRKKLENITESKLLKQC